MAATRIVRALAAIVLIAGASEAAAQQPAGPPAAPAPEPRLAFDREVFAYEGNARRDPFKPLAGKESLGPLFDDLRLKGIIYSPEPTLSIVLIQDGSKRQYRLRRGEVIGNSRVVEIKPLLVRFAVENFGMVKYETLELRTGGYAAAPRGGAAPTAQAEAAAAPATEVAKAEPPLPRVDFPRDNPARSKFLVDSIANERRQQAARQQTKGDVGQPESETRR